MVKFRPGFLLNIWKNVLIAKKCVAPGNRDFPVTVAEVFILDQPLSPGTIAG